MERNRLSAWPVGVVAIRYVLAAAYGRMGGVCPRSSKPLRLLRLDVPPQWVVDCLHALNASDRRAWRGFFH